MSWQTEWDAISNRIASTIEAGTFLTRTGQAVGSDYHGVSSVLIQNAKDTYRELIKFQDAYAALLPDRAADQLSRFLQNTRHWFTGSHLGGWSGLQALAPLASFRAEFTHLISATAAVARSLVERAFLHLQRSIVADEDVARKWRAAFDRGETACEQLGSVHLLQHGIWAFKVSAEGERTDLVLGTRLEITPEIRASSEALVLTEWKVVRGDCEAQAARALQQAKRYAVGCLAGYELESIRYLVLVSAGLIDVPENHQEGSVTHRYVNISVQPAVPSANKRLEKRAGGRGLVRLRG